ncbi:MAG: L,D-transpeptidase family protein [Anaerolineae bacterium]
MTTDATENAAGSTPPDSSMPAQQHLYAILDQGRLAIKQGRMERAQRCFEAILEIDPTQEDALLWLASITPDRDLARDLYQRTLRAHPDSVRAQEALRWLGEPADEPTTLQSGDSTEVIQGGSLTSDEPGDTEEGDAPTRTAPPPQRAITEQDEPPGHDPASCKLVDEQPVSREYVEDLRPLRVMGGSTRQRLPRARVVRDGAMLLMVAFIALGALALGVMLTNTVQADRVRVALGAMTNTPTMSPTATVTPSHTPTITPVHTATATATETALPTVTFTPAPSPTSDWLTAKYLPLPTEGKWIEVDLSDQMLYAFEDDRVVFTTNVSTGKEHTPTVQGKFRIFQKYEAQLMSGPGYYLPNVPYVMYFYGAFALHGAYWHDKWGTPTSHGCVNLRIEDAQWLYAWADPAMPEGAKSVAANAASNPGTIVIVHK